MFSFLMQHRERSVVTVFNLIEASMPAEIPILLKYLPLAMVTLDRNGRDAVGNERFNRDIGMDVMELSEIRDLGSATTPDWKSIKIVVNGKQQNLLARVLEIDSQSTIIFDDGANPQLRAELDKLHEKFARLERLSATDALTEIWNRLHFEKMIALETDRSTRLKQPVSLIIADIDHFKLINDTLGHQVGDGLLRELVKVIQASIRGSDMLFRWGGEEFAVLASATGYRAAAPTAERIRANVAAHQFEVVGHITVSLGVAEYVGVETPGEWFQRADDALYFAKGTRRNRFYVDQRGNSDIWAMEKGLSVIRLEWQEAYGSGHPTFDEEHRKLFELGNEMLDASINAGSELEAFRLSYDRLVSFIEGHFRDEERELEEIGYADLESHKMLHLALLRRAKQLRSEFDGGQASLGVLVDFMANSVIARHMFKEDRKYYHLFVNN